MVNDAKDIEENIGTRKLHYPQSSMLINHLFTSLNSFRARLAPIVSFHLAEMK